MRVNDEQLGKPETIYKGTKAAIEAAFATEGMHAWATDTHESGYYNGSSWTWGSMGADSTAIHDNVSGEIIAITEKTTPADADVTLIEDSAATNAKKRLSWANIKAALKTYYDTLYALVNHTHSGGIDPTAIHNNAANEIQSVTQKLVGFASDEILIEDSEASFVKKRFSLGNLNTYIRNNLDSVYATIAKGVTNGDSHDHNGGDGAQINHTTLSNIGTNTHAALDTFVASKAQASGLASLNASSLVVQNPANATATPAANVIPISDASGKLDGWVSADVYGWVNLGLSATYVSATSFTVVGDYVSYFALGTKIKLTNSTIKYGYILSATYSAPNTTINLIPNTSYSLANAAITDVKISYASPPDFPGYLTWTPSIVAVTVVGTPTYLGRFKITQSRLYFWISMSATTSIATTAGSSQCNNLPVFGNYPSNSLTSNSGGVGVGIGWIDPSVAKVYFPGWSASGLTFYTTGLYEI